MCRPRLPPPKPVSHNRRVVAGTDSGAALSLVPHEHSFFCERKYCVCTSVGKLQELEKLRVKSRAVAAQDLANCGVWTHSAPGVLAHLCGNEEGSLVDTANSFRLSPSQGPRAISSRIRAHSRRRGLLQ